MSKCNRCAIIINDDSDKCPLCRQVLDDDGGVKIDKYPDARDSVRRFRLFENIVLFLSIVAVISVITVNYLVSGNLSWSLLVLFALIYVNVLIRLAIIGKTGYMFKTVCMVVLALLLLWGIDRFTGDNGWSIEFAYPGVVILMNIAIIILMIVNRRNWQSYMMAQIFSIILGLIPLFISFTDYVNFPYIIYGALAMSVFLFLGTLIIGDQRARNELGRRFHI